MTVVTANPVRRAIQRAARPSVNVIETAEAYAIEILAPGLNKADFSIEVENEVLRVHGKRREEEKETENTKKPTFLRREFSLGSIERSFQLPENVDGEKISASYEQGVLVIDLPWKEEAKPMPARAIEIK